MNKVTLSVAALAALAPVYAQAAEELTQEQKDELIAKKKAAIEELRQELNTVTNYIQANCLDVKEEWLLSISYIEKDLEDLYNDDEKLEEPDKNAFLARISGAKEGAVMAQKPYTAYNELIGLYGELEKTYNAYVLACDNYPNIGADKKKALQEVGVEALGEKIKGYDLTKQDIVGDKQTIKNTIKSYTNSINKIIVNIAAEDQAYADNERSYNLVKAAYDEAKAAFNEQVLKAIEKLPRPTYENWQNEATVKLNDLFRIIEAANKLNESLYADKKCPTKLGENLGDIQRTQGDIETLVSGYVDLMKIEEAAKTQADADVKGLQDALDAIKTELTKRNLTECNADIEAVQTSINNLTAEINKHYANGSNDLSKFNYSGTKTDITNATNAIDDNKGHGYQAVIDNYDCYTNVLSLAIEALQTDLDANRDAAAAAKSDDGLYDAATYFAPLYNTTNGQIKNLRDGAKNAFDNYSAEAFNANTYPKSEKDINNNIFSYKKQTGAALGFYNTAVAYAKEQQDLLDALTKEVGDDDAVSLNGSFPVTGETYAQAIANIDKQIKAINTKVEAAKKLTNAKHMNKLKDAADDVVSYDIAKLTSDYKSMKSEFDKNSAINAADAVLAEAQSRINKFQGLLDGITGDFGNQTDAITPEQTRIQGLLDDVKTNKTNAENAYTAVKNDVNAENSAKQDAAATAIASLAEVKDALDKIETDLTTLVDAAKAAVANKAAYDAIIPVIADAQATLDAVMDNPVNTHTHSTAFQYYRDEMKKLNAALAQVSTDTETSYAAIKAVADKETLINAANSIKKNAETFAENVLVNENTYYTQLADVENLQNTWTSVYNTISEKDLSDKAKDYLKDLAVLQEAINTLKNTTIKDAFAKGEAKAQNEAIQAEIKRISDEVIKIGNESKDNYDANVDKTNADQHENFLAVYTTANNAFNSAIETLNKFSTIKNDALQTALDNLIAYHDDIYAYADLLRKLKSDENTDYTKYVNDVTDGVNDIYKAKKWEDIAIQYTSEINTKILEYQDKVNQVALTAFQNTITNAESQVTYYEGRIATFTYSGKADAFKDVKDVIAEAMAAGAIDADGTVHDKFYAVNVDKWMETLNNNLYTMLSNDLAKACDAEKDKLVNDVTAVYEAETTAIAGFGEIDNAAYLAQLETLKANTIDAAVKNYYSSDWLIINQVKPLCEAYYGSDAVTDHSDVYQEAFELSAGNKANLDAYDRMDAALELVVADFNGVAETVKSLIVAHQAGSVFTLLNQIENDLKADREEIESWKNSGLCDDKEQIFNAKVSKVNRDGYPQRIEVLKNITVQNEVVALKAIIDEVKEEYNQVAKQDLESVKEYDAQIARLYTDADAIETKYGKVGITMFEGACSQLLALEGNIAKINSELNAMYENTQIADATAAIETQLTNIEPLIKQAEDWAGYNEATQKLYLAGVQELRADFEAVKVDYQTKVEAGQILIYKDQLLFDLANINSAVPGWGSDLYVEYNKQYNNDVLYAQLSNQLTGYAAELEESYERINAFTHRKAYYGQDVINSTYSNIKSSIATYNEQLEKGHTNVTLAYNDDLYNKINGVSSSIFNMEKDATVYEAAGRIIDLNIDLSESLARKSQLTYGGNRSALLEAEYNRISQLAGYADNYNTDAQDNSVSYDIDGKDCRVWNDYGTWGYSTELRVEYLAEAWPILQERIAQLQADAEKFATDVEDLAYILGDADNDKLVTVNDYSEVRGWILKAKKFEEISEAKRYAGDVNGDEVITVADMTGISNLIFHGSVTGPQAAAPSRARAFDASADQLTVANESEETTIFGKTVRMAVSLSNAEAFTAGQMDIILPQGMKLAGQSLSSRANGHELFANEIAGGTYRLVASTVENNEFNGSNGALIYLDVEVGSDYNGGNITIDNVIFSDAQANSYYLSKNGPIVPTGIEGIEAASVKERIYSVGGQMMKAVKKGINIIVGENNNTKKVVK